MRTTNPALSERIFQQTSPISDDTGVTTVQGAINKTAILTILVMITAGLSWYFTINIATQGIIYPVAIGSAILGFITAIVIIFKKTWAPALAPLYAIFEGIFLGVISSLFEATYSGIVIQAIGLTLAVLFLMLFLYKTGIIKVTAKFRMGVIAATGAIAIVYLLTFILSFFGITVPFIHDAGPIGIGISLVIVTVAALNLVLDFDFIDQAAAYRAPKYMEWYLAFGLMVTLIWLYLEILRLLSKLRRR